MPFDMMEHVGIGAVCGHAGMVHADRDTIHSGHGCTGASRTFNLPSAVYDLKDHITTLREHAGQASRADLARDVRRLRSQILELEGQARVTHSEVCWLVCLCVHAYVGP